ncbi:hypothetical protein OK016_11230 [Vibrio chagasii]|nr:hypothetical protein [Vibrio chagasii]
MVIYLVMHKLQNAGISQFYLRPDSLDDDGREINRIFLLNLIACNCHKLSLGEPVSPVQVS